MRVIKAKAGNMIQLGKIGTSETTQVIFDVSGWTDGLSDFSFELIHQRYGDDEPYPVGGIAYSETDKTVTWTVENSDVANAGWGKAELILVAGQAVAKSQTYGTVVHKALGEALDPPAEYQSWVDKVLAAGAEAKTSVAEAEKYAENAETSAQSSETAKKGAEDARDTAKQYAEEAAKAEGYADKAKEYAEDAETSADHAEQAAKTAGYMFFTNKEGRLIYNKTTNVETDFDLVNGHLEVTIP